MHYAKPGLAADAWDLSPRRLRERAALPHEHPLYIPRRVVDGRYEYALPEDEDEDEATDVPDPEDVYEHPPEGTETESYVFDGQRYLFALKCRRGIFAVDKGTVEAFHAAYSNLGGGATLNEIRRKFGWSRPVIEEIKRALELTHDSAPFTKEQIRQGSDEDLIADVTALKEERILTEAERREWKRVKALAAEFDTFEKFVAAKIREITPPPILSLGKIKPAKRRDGPIVVLSPTDFHAHKMSWEYECGVKTDFETMKARLTDATEKVLGAVLGRCTPSEIVTGIGSDWFHIDTWHATTTKGTPQDVDGTYARVFVQGSALYRSWLATIAEVAPVTCVDMKGNHGTISSIALREQIKILAEHHPRITVEGDLQPRQYLERDKCLIGMTHGDGIADSKLAQMPAVEVPEAFGRTKYRYVFRGHHHTFSAQEYPGVWVMHMPSLAGTDRWHKKAGFIGNRKALAAYVIDPEVGLTDVIPVYVD